MSIERHPNLHAVKFAMSICVPAFSEGELGTATRVKILDAYYNSLRGNATREKVPPIDSMVDRLVQEINKQKRTEQRMLEGRGEEVKDIIVNFVSAVETLVDAAVDNV